MGKHTDILRVLLPNKYFCQKKCESNPLIFQCHFQYNWFPFSFYICYFMYLKDDSEKGSTAFIKLPKKSVTQKS